MPPKIRSGIDGKDRRNGAHKSRPIAESEERGSELLRGSTPSIRAVKGRLPKGHVNFVLKENLKDESFGQMSENISWRRYCELTEDKQMSDKQLDLLKEQLAPLSPQEKLELARFLTEQAKLDQAAEQGEAVIDRAAADVKRAQHMAWLKEHREEYSGQYVALDGDRLVGAGLTIREAHEQARQHRVERPFHTHISSVNDAPFGGW